MKKVLYIALLPLLIDAPSFGVTRSTQCSSVQEAIQESLACDREEHSTCPDHIRTGNYIFKHKDICLILSQAEYTTITGLLSSRLNTGENALLKDIVITQEAILAKRIKRLPEETARLKSIISILKAVVEIAPTATVGSFLKNLKEEYK